MMSYTRNLVIGLFALTVISATISGVLAKPPQRIVGKTYATPTELRFMVTLSYPNHFYHICGGAIISPRHILTAAHCIDNQNPSDYIVRSNLHNRQDINATVSTVKNHFIHSSYVSKPVRNDIGIILLDQDLDLSGVVYKLDLPTAQPDTNKFYSFFGWGRTTLLPQPKNVQMITGVRLLTKEQCLEAGMAYPQYPETPCGIKDDADICYGDSGGPLVYGRTIVGVVSSGACVIGSIHTYTNVYHYLDWINDIIKRTSH